MTNKMWGGRFSKATNELLEDLNASIKTIVLQNMTLKLNAIMMLAKSGVIRKKNA